MLPAKRVAPVVAGTRRRRNLEGSVSNLAPAVTLPLLLPDGGAQGPRFPPPNLLPKMRTMRTTTLILVIRGEGRGPSAISFWPRPAQEVSGPIWTGYTANSLFLHSAPHVDGFNLPLPNAALTVLKMSHTVLRIFPYLCWLCRTSQGLWLGPDPQRQCCSRLCPFAERSLSFNIYACRT
jgi:hypothetical protein